MPKVSVIVPVYNAEKYLSSTLDSVLEQSFTDIEVICVNDGSTDTSMQILEQYASNDDRIRLIDQDNGGGSAARNTGLEAANGEYVMFLDADDIYAKSIIEDAYSRAIQTGVDVVLYNFARFVGRPSKLAIKGSTRLKVDIEKLTQDSYADRLFNDFAIITWNKFIKRDVLTQSGVKFDVSLSHNHDVDFSIRLMLAAESYSWLSRVGYYYRSNDTGITATKRSDPTNVLKILIALDDVVLSSNLSLKRSFDNYVVDMMAGTLDKYASEPEKQKEVFEFCYNKALSAIGLDMRDERYIFSQSDIFDFIRAGEYNTYLRHRRALKRRIRSVLRRGYDALQLVLSRFIA